MKSSSNKKIKAIVVVGARPNFMKAAPVLRAMKKSGKFYPVLVHTGQHYDFLMSEKFFQDLEMPQPDIYLRVKSSPDQIAKIMIAITPHLVKMKPDVVVVVGDVNSTVAAALAAKKLGIKVAHVEAGLRSFDETMPEETNRVITDRISDFLFTTEESGNTNLRDEGIAAEKIHFVGNTMIDSLLYHLTEIQKSMILNKLNLRGRNYRVLTLHRPSNVDNIKKLDFTFGGIETDQWIKEADADRDIKIVFPVHPRTRQKIDELIASNPSGQSKNFIKQCIFTKPLGYLDFIQLIRNAEFVMTDSGGIQEETTHLGIPCFTIRNNTERPITMEAGTNTLITDQEINNPAKLNKVIRSGCIKKGRIPKYWDGKAAERIVKILAKNL